MIILHGEDSTKSYNRLIALIEEQKVRQVEVVIQDAAELDLTYLRQEISSSGLFGTGKCFVIKNLLCGNKSKNKEKLLEVIDQNQDHEVIFWESKALSATILKPFAKARVESFPISPVIFKFLDALRPGNTRLIMLSWKKLLEEGTEPEFVFAMLTRQIRLLIQAKSGPGNLKMAPYPARLITAQAGYFSFDHLLDLYQRLYRIDVQVKTGTSATTIDYLLGHFLQKI
jgi:DNA polymerase III delta subunit